ncbi:MAG: hypothetical protein HY270_23320 [Deltaproteobacteria bacterium]|nr:hypothetical protein [Deltaproteobacteria bacterium]
MSSSTQDVNLAFAEDTRRITGERFVIGAVAFGVVFALAWIFEHETHPERDITYATMYGLEVAVILLAIWISRRRTGQRYVQPIAAAAAVAIIVLVCTYNVIVHGNTEVLTMALLYVEVGTMVLFPWGWRGQVPVAVGGMIAFVIAVNLGTFTTTPLSMHLLGLGMISALTVSGSGYLERHRFGVFRQTNALRAANEALAAANQALEDANRTKNEFLASVSHELRTPLNIILGYADLLSDGEFGGLDEDARDAVDRIGRTCRTLVFLISDLLDLSRIEAGRLAIRPGRVEISQMFDDIRRFVEPRLVGKNVRLVTESDEAIAVTADRDRLEQILLNLLSNAVKFTHDGEIAIRVRHGDDGRIAVDVSDTGVGIDAAELTTLFEPFRQGQAGREAGGVGIGLALSARLAGAMGGTLTAISQIGRGSTFTLRLPAAEEK